MTEKNHPAPRTPRPSAGTRGPKAKPKSRGKRILFGFLRFVAVMMCLGIMAVSVAGVLLSLYVVNATKNDGELLNLEELKLSYTSVEIGLPASYPLYAPKRRIMALKYNINSSGLCQAPFLPDGENFYGSAVRAFPLAFFAARL